MKALLTLIIHAAAELKLGVCTTCHMHKLHCEISPGATVCEKGVNNMDEWPPVFMGQLIPIPHTATLLLLILRLFILSLDTNKVIPHPLVPVVSLSLRDVSQNHKEHRSSHCKVKFSKFRTYI